MVKLSDFTDGIPFSFMRKQKRAKKTKKRSRSPSRKRKRTRRTKRKPIKVPPRGVIIRKKGKLYKSDGKRLTLIE
tara:strand:- start:438 stop:662 length:225 start_codon:yes stop_codon:yes gene_type:complete